jgi:aryl-alcohol dehydrogenase-like predicted oxidoreductase
MLNTAWPARAHAVHPLTAIEAEWSLFSRDIEAEIVPTCRELGISSWPLSRGFLSGTLTPDEVAAPGPFMGKVRAGPALLLHAECPRACSPDASPLQDFRAVSSRFAPEAWAANAALVERIAAAAKAKGCTTAQLALAWVHAQGAPARTARRCTLFASCSARHPAAHRAGRVPNPGHNEAGAA